MSGNPRSIVTDLRFIDRAAPLWRIVASRDHVMSLWAAEVEKSKTNPNPPRRRRKTTAEQISLVQSPGRNRDNFRSLLGAKPAIKAVDIEVEPLDSQRDVIGERDTLLQENATLRRKIRKMADEASSQMPTSQENVAQLADLIVQKIELERDIRSREAKYETLLRESQELMNTMRAERDAALQKLQTAQQGYDSDSVRRRRPSLTEVKAPRDNLDFDEIPFEAHDNDHFQYQFHALEQSIKQFTLSSMASQPDAIAPREVSPAMDVFIHKHSLKVATVFAIRDVRCLLARSFSIEFLMDRIFRVFLFGLDPEHGRIFQEAVQLFLRSSGSIEAGTKWAAKVARMTVRSSSAYRPRVAVERLVEELTGHLSPLLGGRGPVRRDALLAVVQRAVDLARDCRLDYSSFSIELPCHRADFDPARMEASRRETGSVAVAYAPVVTRRGDRYGEGYEYGQVVAKAKVWRESIFSSVQDLTDDPEADREYEYM